MRRLLGKHMRKVLYRIQRSRRYRRNLCLKVAMLFAALLVMLCVFVKRSTFADAAESNPAIYEKSYVKYYVSEGDTLWDLAGSFGESVSIKEYIKEARSINHLQEEDKIMTGEMLVLPYYEKVSL